MCKTDRHGANGCVLQSSFAPAWWVATGSVKRQPTNWLSHRLDCKMAETPWDQHAASIVIGHVHRKHAAHSLAKEICPALAVVTFMSRGNWESQMQRLYGRSRVSQKHNYWIAIPAVHRPFKHHRRHQLRCLGYHLSHLRLYIVMTMVIVVQHDYRWY